MHEHPLHPVQIESVRDIPQVKVVLKIGLQLVNTGVVGLFNLENLFLVVEHLRFKLALFEFAVQFGGFTHHFFQQVDFLIVLELVDFLFF